MVPLHGKYTFWADIQNRTLTDVKNRTWAAKLKNKTTNRTWTDTNKT